MNILFTFSLVFLSAPALSAVRPKRLNENKFSEAVAKVEMVARVVNGISLGIGMIDGSGRSDEVIRELMSVPEVDLEKLETFNRTAIDETIKDIQTAIQNVNSSGKEQDSFEETVKLETSWGRRYKQLGDVKKLGDSDAYFQEIGRVKDVKVKDTFTTELTQSISKALPFLNNLSSLPDEGTVDKKLAFYIDMLVNLREELTKINGSSQKMLNFFGELQKLKPLAKNNFPVSSSQNTFVSMVLKYYAKTSTLQLLDNKSDLKTLLTATSEVSNQLKRHLPDLSIINSLVQSRRMNAQRKETNGFPNGYSDIEKLKSDVNTPFYHLFVGNASKTIQMTLEPLEEWRGKLKEVEKKWTGLFTNQFHQSVQVTDELVELSNKVHSMTSSEAESYLVATDSKIKGPSISPKYHEKVTKIFENGQILRSRLEALIAIGETVSGMKLQDTLSDITNLMTIIKLSEDIVKQANEIQPTMKKVRSFTKFPEIMKTLETLKNLTVEIGKHDISTLLSSLATDGKKHVDEFFSDSKTNEVIAFFDGLGKEQAFEKISGALELADKLRSLKNGTDYFNSTKALAETIESSIPTVKEARKYPEELRKSQKYDEKDLKGMRGMQNHTSTVGESVTFLRSVRAVMEKKVELQEMISDGKKVGKMVEDSTVAGVAENWSNFTGTAENLTFLLTEFERVVKSLNVSVIEQLDDLSPLFSGFSQLRDVDLEIPSRLRALELLLPSVSGSDAGIVSEFKRALSPSLSQIDLKFASHQTAIEKMPKAMTEVRQVLEQVSAGTIRAPTPPGSHPPFRSRPSTPSPANSTEAEATGISIGYWIGGAFVVVVVFLFFVLIYMKCFKKKKTKGPPPKKEPAPVVPRRDPNASASHTVSTESVSKATNPEKKEPVPKSAQKSTFQVAGGPTKSQLPANQNSSQTPREAPANQNPPPVARDAQPPANQNPPGATRNPPPAPAQNPQPPRNAPPPAVQSPAPANESLEAIGTQEEKDMIPNLKPAVIEQGEREFEQVPNGLQLKNKFIVYERGGGYEIVPIVIPPDALREEGAPAHPDKHQDHLEGYLVKTANDTEQFIPKEHLYTDVANNYRNRIRGTLHWHKGESLFVAAPDLRVYEDMEDTRVFKPSNDRKFDADMKLKQYQEKEGNQISLKTPPTQE